jgi:hypothetical protein
MSEETSDSSLEEVEQPTSLTPEQEEQLWLHEYATATGFCRLLLAGKHPDQEANRLPKLTHKGLTRVLKAFLESGFSDKQVLQNETEKLTVNGLIKATDMKYALIMRHFDKSNKKLGIATEENEDDKI